MRAAKAVEEGVAYFRKQNRPFAALADVTMSMVEDAKGHLGDVVWRALSQCGDENGRTQEPRGCWEGRSMKRWESDVVSHQSLGMTMKSARPIGFSIERGD